MAYENATNPIYSVDGATIPCPSGYEYHAEDVSQSSAGRTEDGVMHKKMLGTTRAVVLTWQNISTATLHTILDAFQGEYHTIIYLDPEIGTASNNYYVSRQFYVGNRSAPMYNHTMKLWSNVSFKIITTGVS